MRTLILTFLAVIYTSPAIAEGASEAFRSTDYPLPRFVSLRSDEVFVRSGPGRKYPVQWVFKKKGIPVEVVLEYDVWRKIKDAEGEQGWVHKSLLSGKRTGLIQGEQKISIYKKQNQNSTVLAYFEPNVQVELDECSENWCRVIASGYKGWVPQKHIWGVYEAENFD